jgi:hypothetical protein
MMGRRRFVSRAVWLAPLLAGCVVRWESTPENEEYWDASGRDRPLPDSPGAWSDPGSSLDDESDRPPPLTSESEYPEKDEPDEASLPAGLYRDLIVLDPSIVAGPLAARDDADAPFSFRAQMEWLAGAARDPWDFTRSWLLAWENTSEVGPELAPVTPRPAVRRLLVDAWFTASGVPPGNSVPAYGDASGDATGDAPDVIPASDDPPSSDQGDAPSGYPSPEPADDPESAEPDGSGYGEPADPYGPPPPPSSAPPSWAYAPFRLIAIVNRVDLASDACSGYPGELRYVYAAVDPLTSRPLDVTVILEVPYPTTRPAAEWAQLWRELAALPEAAYVEGLARLTREVRAEADPLRARLRSNEIAFSNPAEPTWEMREFQLQVRGDELELAQVPLEFTPRSDVDPATLSAYVLEHAEEIEASGARLPDELRAGAASIGRADFSWPVLGVSERSRRAFSVQTCNGCHGGDTAALPFRHVGPGLSLDSPARVSRYMYDPDATSDELRRRSDVLDTLTATACDAPAESDGYAGP